MITLDRLKQLLKYDANTGNFIWNCNKGKCPAGTQAGRLLKSGYILIGLDGETYRGHKLAIYYCTGDYPDYFVDHIDGNKANNKFENLRKVTKQQNAFNMRLKVNNTSGTKGVSWRKDRNSWRVYLKVNSKYKSFGHYTSLELAELVAAEARNKYHGEFARHE